MTISTLENKINDFYNRFNSVRELSDKISGRSKTYQLFKETVNKTCLVISNMNSDDPEVVYNSSSSIYNTLLSFSDNAKYIPDSMGDIRYTFRNLIETMSQIRNSSYRLYNDKKSQERKIAEQEEQATFDREVSEYIKELKNSKLSLDWFKEHKTESAYTAFCKVLRERVPDAYVGMIRDIICGYKNNEVARTSVYPYSEQMKGLVDVCQHLHVKQFAFTGECTALMRCLYDLNRLGCSFEISSYKEERPVWNNNDVKIVFIDIPMCIINIPQV